MKEFLLIVESLVSSGSHELFDRRDVCLEIGEIGQIWANKT